MKSLLILLFSTACATLVAQSNIIFLGGTGEGSSLTCVESVVSNQIFKGSIADGYTSTRIFSTSNGAIYAGGAGDGVHSERFTQSVTNAIYAGGFGDGENSARFIQSVSNAIYAGGGGDGSDSRRFTDQINNAMFAGGIGDGFDKRNATTTINNQIFAGATGDGADLGRFSINLPTIVWHGNFNSNWNVASNWNLNRVPTIEDQVIIDTQVHDPDIVNAQLGVGIQVNPISRFARNLYVLEGSTLKLSVGSRLHVSKLLHTYGDLASNGALYPAISLLPQGEIRAFPNASIVLNN